MKVMETGERMAQAKTAQTMHKPNVEHVSSKGLVLMEVTKSATLHGEAPVSLEGKFMKTGIPKSCIGVTIRLIATEIVVMAAVNMLRMMVVQNARVANVDIAGMGKIPPQTPTATARPI
jgi:hypothetical protein